jgi:monovalent cation:H+ antiporter-2, CPA2 family
MMGIDFIRDLAVVMGVAGAVGWACQRVGLSLVVGYLAAGAIIGPSTPPFQLVTDLERVQMLSQVGLVFLIFAIGLNLGLQRLRRLGMPMLLATTVGAVIVFNGCRLFGLAAGWTETQSLFFAGMLMVSSSAIISKILQELNSAHRREGQLALGITVMEDIVAVVMLTLLSSLVRFGGIEPPPLAQTVGTLSAFIGLLALTAFFFVPRLLLGLTQAGRPEVRTIILIALLLFLAWLAQRAGYSMALGAFLLGVVVASTPQKAEIERVFEGLRDMFGAVFFVAMGMLVDFQLLTSAWPMVLAVTAFTIVWRPLATSIGLVLAGNETRESLRASLALTPLGEFSFIIAQFGVVAGAIPPSFYPIAVGTSLLTSLVAPSLMRRSNPISHWIDERLPLPLREWIAFYHSWLEQMARKRQRSFLWKLTSGRLTQTGAQILFVSGLVLFVRPLYRWVQATLGNDWLFENGTVIVFWTLFGVVVLAPLVAIWRNVGSLSMILAEWMTKDMRRKSTLQPLIERSLQTAAAVVLGVWLLAVMPFGVSVLWAFLVVLGFLLLVAVLLWRRLVYWQSRLEIEMSVQMQHALGTKEAQDLQQLLREHQSSWQLHAEEYVLPEFSALAGRRIGELALRKRFGCSIASIDRHGIVIANPSADVVLYPQDRLLLLGSTEQIDKAMIELGVVRTQPDQEIEEFSLETITVAEHSPRAGKTLAELDPFRHAGVQVAGIQRGPRQILTPSGSDKLETGDELLVLGTTQQIQDFAEWLNEAAPR